MGSVILFFYIIVSALYENRIVGRNQWALPGRVAVFFRRAGSYRRQDFVVIGLRSLMYTSPACGTEVKVPVLRKFDTPQPWQWAFQVSASSQMEGISDLYSDIMSMLVAVGVSVLYLIVASVLYWNFSVADKLTSVATTVRQVLSTFRPAIAYRHLTSLEFV